MFPIHVEKFYFIFHALINPYIDEIKSLIWRLWCCSFMIPSHLSILRGFISKVSTFGRSVDIQHFVLQHKTALDEVITHIKGNLERDIQHIEDVLDNVTGNTDKKLPGMMDKIYKDLSKEARSIRFTSWSLWSHLYSILKLFIDGIHTKLSRDKGYFVKNLQADYLSYTDELPKIKKLVKELNYPVGGRGKGIYIKTGKTFTADQIVYFDKINEGLTKIREGERNLSDNSIDEILKDNHTLVTRVRTSLEQVISAMGEDLGPKSVIDSGRIWMHISKLEKNFRRLKILRCDLCRTRKLDGLLSGVRTLKNNYDKIKDFLTDDYQNLIQRLPALVTPATILEQICGLENSIRHIIGKLRTAIKYRKILRSLGEEIQRLPRAMAKGSADQSVLVQSRKLELLESRMYEIENKIDQFISAIDSDFKVDDIQMEVILRSPKQDICEIKKGLEEYTKSYIKKLKAVKDIEPHMKLIEEKKSLLSCARSNIGGITNVENGITEMKKVQSTMKEFGFVATAITSLEHSYNSEARSLIDIGVGVKYLKDIIINTRKLRSDIESYIKFLEEIKESSKILEGIFVGSGNVLTVKTTGGELVAWVSYLKDKLSSIGIDIGRLKQIKCRVFDLKQVKQNIKAIRDVIVRIREGLVSVQDITNRINNENAKISNQLKIIRELEQIGSHIESSSLTLSSIGISYQNPSSETVKCNVEYLSRIARSIEFIGSYTVKTIYGKIESITKEIKSLEQKIDSFMICFLNCSNKTITENTIESTKRMLASWGQVYNNESPKSISDTRNVPGGKINKDDNVWTRFEFHDNPHWDDQIVEQRIRDLYETNLSIRTLIQSDWLTMF